MLAYSSIAHAGYILIGIIAANEARMAGATRQGGVPLRPGKYAGEVPVRIVAGYGRRMEVKSNGLTDGMPLVTRGTYLLAHGSPVRFRPKEGAARGSSEPAAGRPTGESR
jgi:hypothetical protein